MKIEYQPFNSFTTKKQTTKFSSANLQRNVNFKLYLDLRANSVDLDEVAHYKPPHQDLRCLQIQFSSLVLKELTALSSFSFSVSIRELTEN